KSLKWINELQYDGKRTHLEFTAYLNPIKDYIYLNPTGEVYVSLRGTFNIYEYLQANAFFYGFDFAGSYEFTDRINAYLKGAIVQAKNTTENNYFPFIHTNRMDWGVSYDFAKNTDSPTNKITLSNDLVTKQNSIRIIVSQLFPPIAWTWAFPMTLQRILILQGIKSH